MPGEYFNPPPNWPVPRGWTPPPNWEPDRSWPPAAPGWQFWTEDEPEVDEQPWAPHAVEPTEQPPPPAAPPGWTFWTDSADVQPPSGTELPVSSCETPSRKKLWRRPTTIFLVLGFVASLVVAFLVVRVVDPGLRIDTQPHTEKIPSGGGVSPDWPSPWAANVDFSSWTTFGGIDAEFSDHGRSVLLDTHDTTETWRTKWSGLIQDGPSMCAMRFTGRARDVSHAAGVPGGFGIGLATLGPGDPDTADLSGTAIQFDFGQQGFRSASYPTDTDFGLEPAPLDHQWHQIEVIVKETSHTLVVDGRTVTNREVPGRCGNPVIRVWAGSAEFTDFTFGKLGW
jgi:hypothetical protein